MAYKDKDKQRKAIKEANRRYRAKAKGITQRVNNIVIPETDGLTIRNSQSVSVSNTEQTIPNSITEQVLPSTPTKRNGTSYRDNSGQSSRSVRGSTQNTRGFTHSPDSYSVKPPEVLASRLRSRQGSAKPGDASYPEQTGLNTCNVCGCKLEWDVLDVCLPCAA